VTGGCQKVFGKDEGVLKEWGGNKMGGERGRACENENSIPNGVFRFSPGVFRESRFLPNFSLNPV
jgi:hypothetical protein